VYFRYKLNQWNRSLGMVGRALDADVFLCDDLYMSNAGVICEGRERMQQVSRHKFP